MQDKVRGGAHARYQAALDEGRFLIQHCRDCGKHVFYPREFCPHCESTGLAWVEPSGTGTVYSSSTVRRKPDDGGDYNVSLIDLDEGVRMMSRVDGVAPERVRIGMRVRAKVVDCRGSGVVVFDIAGDGANEVR